MDWIVRLDVVLLALMLAYVVVLWTRGVYLSYSKHDEVRDAAANVKFGMKALYSISAVAPFLGVAGSCFGILEMFSGFGMEAHAVLIMMASRAAAALVPTLLGLAIGVVAQFVEWFLRGRIDATELRALRCLESVPSQLKASFGGYQKPRRFPLQARFSQLPAFPILAGPSLILLVTWFMPFHVATGFQVRLMKVTPHTSTDWHPGTSITLTLTPPRNAGAGNVYVNGKQTKVQLLRDVLLRGQTDSSQTIFISAEGNVQWAEVANVIDAAKFANKNVVLLTTALDIQSATRYKVLNDR